MTPRKYDDDLTIPETCGACGYWRYLYTTVAEHRFGVCGEYSSQVKSVIVIASTIRPPECRAWIADASQLTPLPRALAQIPIPRARPTFTLDLFGGPPS